ncbi:MAG: hypothetical protein NT032_01335 [Actinobacteria bacterium]|nr:hypothetical protein [Actinomycetota bacterium]
MNKIRKLLVYPIAVLTVIISAPAAFAVQDLRDTYVGLVLSRSGVQLGELYNSTDYQSVNIYGRYANDTTGDRLQVKGKVRDNLLENGQQIYVKAEKWDNSVNCYLTGIGGGTNSISLNTACSTGWHFDGEMSVITDSVSGTGSGPWQLYKFQYFTEPSMSSQKISLRVCEDEPWFLSDECTAGARILGIDWN